MNLQELSKKKKGRFRISEGIFLFFEFDLLFFIKNRSFSEGYAMQAYQQNNDVLPEN